MVKQPKVFIKHIIDASEIVLRYVRGVTRSEFDRRRMLRDAVVRQIEIIGEASKNLDLQFRKQ